MIVYANVGEAGTRRRCGERIRVALGERSAQHVAGLGTDPAVQRARGTAAPAGRRHAVRGLADADPPVRHLGRRRGAASRRSHDVSRFSDIHGARLIGRPPTFEILESCGRYRGHRTPRSQRSCGWPGSRCRSAPPCGCL